MGAGVLFKKKKAYHVCYSFGINVDVFRVKCVLFDLGPLRVSVLGCIAP
jgi:hypothetical protein